MGREGRGRCKIFRRSAREPHEEGCNRIGIDALLPPVSGRTVFGYGFHGVPLRSTPRCCLFVPPALQGKVDSPTKISSKVPGRSIRGILRLVRGRRRRRLFRGRACGILRSIFRKRRSRKTSRSLPNRTHRVSIETWHNPHTKRKAHGTNSVGL